MLKRKEYIPIVMFLVFIAVGIAKAEPTPTVSYLMDTPVSMLDFGIYRLEKYLNEESKKLTIGKAEPKIDVQYIYEINSIVITVRYFLEPEYYERHNIKQEITAIMGGIKESYFGYDLTTGEKTVLGKTGYTVINSFFSHEGYTLKNQPKNFVEDLEKTIQINVMITAVEHGKDYLTIGKSPLLGKEIYWVKYGKDDSTIKQ